jgi:hypothetical protein
VSVRGSLRASDEDREQVVGRLHKAATEGRIGSDELEQRVSQALKARTYAELEATVADLPKPGRAPAHRRAVGGWALATVREYPILIVFAIPVLAVTTAVLIAATALWATLLVIFLLVGRRTIPRRPWGYARHYDPRRYSRYARHYGPGRYHPRPHHRPRPGGRPGDYWAS